MMRNAAEDSESLPPIAALFLVVFDQKVGYKIAWQRSLSDGMWTLFHLEGVVEYKSLPSGLHNVQSDLIYFTHDNQAGVSAFVSKSATEAERNAHFAAVGVLVPLSYGRLGRAWMHASELRQLAETAVDDQNETENLEAYWDEHRLADAGKGTATDSTSSRRRKGSESRSRRQSTRSRAFSDATGGPLKDHILPLDHPAMSMSEFLDVFGPLAFPVYRAALLRKRILIVGSAPVQRSCNFVYDLSIFSNVPPSLSDVLPTPNSLLRIRPMFNVGVHDISELAKTKPSGDTLGDTTEKTENGWLACTTDDILATKTDLYDLLITMPNGNSEVKQWPTVANADRSPVRATQRDLRRFNTLRRELWRMQRMQDRKSRYRDEDEDDVEQRNEHSETQLTSADINDGDDDDDTSPLVQPHRMRHDDNEEGPLPLENESAILEPSSWASIAYTSFLWWASAGERDALLADETSQDSALLDDLSLATSPAVSQRPASRGSGKGKGKRSSDLSLSSGMDHGITGYEQQEAMVLIAYFHRLTAGMLQCLADVVAAADDESEAGEAAEGVLVVGDEDLRRMGLDVWSAADEEFVKALSELYFSRQADVRGGAVECCGVRIC